MNNFPKKFYRRTAIYLGFALFIFLYFLLLSKGIGWECPVNKYMGIKCFGCGATRAFISLISLDFEKALHYNRLFTLIIYPALLFLFAQDYICAIIQMVKKRKSTSFIDKIFKTK